MKRRIIGALILLLAILFLPYWVYIPLLFIATVLFPLYWEAVLFGFLIDVLYGQGHSWLLSPTALAALVILIVLLPLRERLRWQI